MPRAVDKPEIWLRDLDGYLVVRTEAHRNPFNAG
jgi:hypothetical protein